MNLTKASKLALTAVLVGAAAWVGTNQGIYLAALDSAFFSLALASVIIIHLRVRPSWADVAAIAALTISFAAVDLGALHFKSFPMAWFSFAGLSSLLVLGVRATWAEGSARRLLLLGFIPSSLFVLSEYFADDMLHWTASMHPKVLDLYLLSFDASMRVQLSFLTGKLFYTWPYLRLIALVFYIALPIPIAVIYAGRLRRMGDKALPAMAAFLVTGPLGILFYNLFPALGPAHLFGGNFPWHPLPIEQLSHLLAEPVPLTGAPNAIPSLHMAWVLLVCWYSRGLSWWERAIAILFLIFTILATLGTGEHYFIDLIVAFPFAVLIESICAVSMPINNAYRLLGMGFGLLLTLGWLCMLRAGQGFFWSTPVLPWSFCLATVALSILFERQLHRIQGANQVEPVAEPSAS